MITSDVEVAQEAGSREGGLEVEGVDLEIKPTRRRTRIGCKQRQQYRDVNGRRRRERCKFGHTPATVEAKEENDNKIMASAINATTK